MMKTRAGIWRKVEKWRLFIAAVLRQCLLSPLHKATVFFGCPIRRRWERPRTSSLLWQTKVGVRVKSQRKSKISSHLTQLWFSASVSLSRITLQHFSICCFSLVSTTNCETVSILLKLRSISKAAVLQAPSLYHNFQHASLFIVSFFLSFPQTFPFPFFSVPHHIRCILTLIKLWYKYTFLLQLNPSWFVILLWFRGKSGSPSVSLSPSCRWVVLCCQSALADSAVRGAAGYIHHYNWTNLRVQ